MRSHITKYLDCEELEEDSGIAISECHFVEEEECGAMILLDCSDRAIKGLENDIVYFYREAVYVNRIEKYENTLALIKFIRKNSRVTDSIYIHWYW